MDDRVTDEQVSHALDCFHDLVGVEPYDDAVIAAKSFDLCARIVGHLINRAADGKIEKERQQIRYKMILDLQGRVFEYIEV